VSVNKAIIIGRLGADPEVRYTQGGQSVANFNLATDEVWTDKSGQRQEKVEWHKVVVWGRQAELCGEYLRKGREVYVEGRIETREWQDREGQRRFTTEIKAQNVRFLGGRNDGNYDANRSSNQSAPAAQGGYEQNQAPAQPDNSAAPAPQNQAPQNQAPQNQAPQNQAPQNQAPPGAEFNDDDIPF
jgi:single-strand DNA-binding protein